MSVQAPAQEGLRQAVHDAARRARVAARALATLNTATKNRALHAAADSVLAHVHEILAANAADLDAARATGTPDAILDRLALNPRRVDGIAAGLRQVAGLPDPIGEVLRGRTLPNGLQIRQQRVPLGVVGYGLRGQAQRHRRRLRLDLEVRQRRAAARQLVGRAVQRRARHGAPCRTRRRGSAARRRAAAAQ